MLPVLGKWPVGLAGLATSEHRNHQSRSPGLYCTYRLDPGEVFSQVCLTDSWGLLSKSMHPQLLRRGGTAKYPLNGDSTLKPKIKPGALRFGSCI